VGVYGEEALPEGENLQEILADLPRLGVTHVLDVQWQGTNFGLPQHIRDLGPPWQGRSFALAVIPPSLTLVFEGAKQRVYRVN
jgi:hypothetical protein